MIFSEYILVMFCTKLPPLISSHSVTFSSVGCVSFLLYLVVMYCSQKRSCLAYNLRRDQESQAGELTAEADPGA